MRFLGPLRRSSFFPQLFQDLWASAERVSDDARGFGISPPEVKRCASAKTIVTGEFVPVVGGSQYVGMTYTDIDANTLRVTVVCNSGTTPSGTFNMYYTVNGSQITLTAVGSSDVSVL